MYKFKAKHVILESHSLPHGVASRDVPERLTPKDDNNCAGLPHTLKLAVGVQVMLRKNIMWEDGPVNDAHGRLWVSSGQMEPIFKHNLEFYQQQCW